MSNILQDLIDARPIMKREDPIFEKFEKVRLDMPALKVQHATTRFGFFARTDSAVIVKFSRKTKIMINPDNTWEFI